MGHVTSNLSQSDATMLSYHLTAEVFQELADLSHRNRYPFAAKYTEVNYNSRPIKMKTAIMRPTFSFLNPSSLIQFQFFHINFFSGSSIGGIRAQTRTAR